jgi:Ion transport protein
MLIKMIAMGVCGQRTYLADSWNRLDFFIVMSGALEYFSQVENLNLTAIRTIRVLRPLRAINRIPSELNKCKIVAIIISLSISLFPSYLLRFIKA